ncbi:MAG: bacteriocin [Lactobacillus sp.]|nr:bacteriocin [Lactobacillus sp.]
MYKKVKIALLMVISCLALFQLSAAIYEYEQNSIANAHTAIQVSSDSHKLKKSQVFSELAKFSKENGTQLTFAHMNEINGALTKSYYDFNPNKPADPALFKNIKLQKLSYKDLQLEATTSIYYTSASGNKLLSLQSEFSKLGLTASVSKPSLAMGFLTNDLLSTYVPIMISIVAILLVIMFIEKISRFKEYAILKLHGYSTFKLLKRDLAANSKKYGFALGIVFVLYMIWSIVSLKLAGLIISFKWTLLLLLVTFIFFEFLELISYVALLMLDLYPALQGQTYTKPFVFAGYVIKLALLILVFSNAISLQQNATSFASDKAIMHMWIDKHSGYTLGLSNIDPNDDKLVQKIGNKIKQLVNEDPDAIISHNNQEFNPDTMNANPQNGNVLIVNANYFKYNRIVKPNQLDKNNINVLIPISRKAQQKSIVKQAVSYYEFQKSLDNKKLANKHFNVLYYQDQNLFNYTIGKEIKASVSKNPVVIVDNGNLSTDFYSSSASMGMIQFGNLKSLTQNIKKVGLTPYVSGITNAQTRLSDFIVKMTRKLIMLTVVTLLSLSQLVFVIVFIGLSFLQNQRRRMAIRQIFGESNKNIIARLVLVNVLVDLLIVIFVAVTMSSFVFIYFVGYLILELLVIMLLVKHAQKDLLTSLNYGN